MFDRTGRDAIGRSGTGPRGRSKAGRRLAIEPLEGRALMTASLAPLPSVTVQAGAGYQVPLNGMVGGNADPQTYTVSTFGPTGGVTASVAQGQFLTIGVSHVSGGAANDPSFTGTMVFQEFSDLTPNAVQKIDALVNGTAPFSQLTPAAQQVIYPNGANSPGRDYYVVGGNTFHRISASFPGPNDYIVQGGSLNHDGTGQVYAQGFGVEINPQLAFNGTGQLALANTGAANSNDSQFFVTTGSPRFLDNNYTIFGQLVSGQDTLARLAGVTLGNPNGTTPVGPTTITSATVTTTNPDGVLHINATGATAGTQTNVTVTATDAVNNTQVSRTFPVLTVPSSADTTSTTTAPRLNTVTTPLNFAQGQPITFQLSASNPTAGALTYTVQGGLTNGAFTPVQNATATVSPAGQVTVTPNPGYTGTINLVVGARDQTDRTGSGTLASPANYSTQNVQVLVGAFATAPTLNAVPTPIPFSLSQDVRIQLTANNPTGGVLSYAVQGGLTNGAFTPVQNATATVDNNGLVTVTPNPGFTGNINLLVGVRDQTDRSGTGNLNTPSNFSTQAVVLNFVAAGGNDPVRFLPDGNASNIAAGVLVATPPPRTDNGTNTVAVTQAGGNVHVTINGVLDPSQPAVGNVDQIIVYGSKANDRITVDPGLTIPVTLDGGHGGRNVIQAGGGPAREHGWFGQDVLKQGSSNNYLLGRRGHVTFVKGSGTSDVIFAGTPMHFVGNNKVRHLPTPTTGTYYTFNGTRLVPTRSPYTPVKTTNNTPKGTTTTTTTVTKSQGPTNTSTVTISKVAKPAAPKK